MSSFKKLAAAAAVVAVSSSLLVGLSGVASATAGQCAGGANGFVDIADNLTGTVVRRSDGGDLTLEVGIVKGVKRGWARAHSFDETSVLDRGDSVWMDWSQDGGNTWLQCGPFSAPGNLSSITSAAKATNPSPNWRFRAGAIFNGVQTLTSWY